jgi:AcrR family transcriptional regulator
MVRHMAPVGFAVRTERDEVLAATARVVARRGYAAATLTEIAIDTGMSRRRVLRLVGDVEDCFWALFAQTFHQTFARVLTRTQDLPWPLSVREGLTEFLELLAIEPAYVRANLAGIRALGADGSLRLATAIEAFTAFLTPGYDLHPHHPIPPLVAELIGSSVLHVITQHVAEDRIAELPSALPQLLSVALMPFCAAEDIDALLAIG